MLFHFPFRNENLKEPETTLAFFVTGGIALQIRQPPILALRFEICETAAHRIENKRGSHPSRIRQGQVKEDRSYPFSGGSGIVTTR
jgi:hypothetical protein